MKLTDENLENMGVIKNKEVKEVKEVAEVAEVTPSELSTVDIEQIAKDNRRKMFWRLYGLPWILLTIFLVLLSGSLLFNNYQKSVYIQKQIMVKEMKPELPIFTPSFDITNMYIHLARMEDRLTQVIGKESKESKESKEKVIVVTQYIDRVVCVTNEIIRTNVIHDISDISGVRDIRDIRDIRYGQAEVTIAKGLNYDVEKELKQQIDKMLEIELSNWPELSNKLQIRSDVIIKRIFDGFETYQRIRK